MAFKIDLNSAYTVSEAVHSAQINTKQEASVQFRDQLVSANESGFCGSVFGKIFGVFTWFKNTIVSIFRIIFCCDCSAGIGGKSNLANIAEAKQFFVGLREDFVDESHDDRSDEKQEFTEAWKAKFNSFNEEIQSRIVKEEMRGWAIGKKLKGDDITSFVESAFEIEEKRSKALSFVRDLKPVADAGGRRYYPIKEVPILLARIIDDLEKQLKAAEKAN